MSKIITITAATAALLFVSACDNLPQTGKDALAGGIAGGTANYIMGENVAQGAAVGAGAGAIISQIKN